MKKVIFLSLAVVFFLSSCGSAKNVVSSSPVQGPVKTVTSIEGAQVRQQSVATTGIEMSNALSEDGTQIIQRPYKWFSGIATSNNQQVAIEMAQREAYATLSRELNNAVKDNAERSTVGVSESVQSAIKSYWEQVSLALTKACGPFGDAVVNYDPATKKYTVIAKIGVRGDKYNQLIESAGAFQPEGLKDSELQEFLALNKAIIEAAKAD